MSSKPFSDAAETWNKRFDQPDYVFGTSPNAYLESRRPLFEAGGRALCVADGEGRNSVWLAQLGLQVDAFDISSTGVAKAQKLAQQAGVSVAFNISDCDSWNWTPEQYDYVIAIFVQFADPEMRSRLFANMSRTLKPGGYLVLQGYTPKQLEYRTGGPGLLENLYTEDLLHNAFPDLDIVELTMYEAELNEGARHAGLSALAGLTARKR